MSDSINDVPQVYIAIDGVTVEASKAPKNDGDRTFRNAWAINDKNVVIVDMEKARVIQLDAIRAARKPLLDLLDVAYQRADEEDDAETKAAVVLQKKALRDVTKDARIAAAKTPEALAALTLEALTAK